MATASESPVRGRRSAGHLWILLGVFVTGSVVLTAIADWRAHHLFLVNATHSLPNWAFLIRRGALPERGEYVFFDPPHSALIKRHFGARPQMFGKIIYGMPGDIIAHDGSRVQVNGREVARMKAVTKLGEALTPGVTGATASESGAVREREEELETMEIGHLLYISDHEINPKSKLTMWTK